MPNPHGQIVDKSHSGGMGVGEFWQKLFEENEQRWQDRKLDNPPRPDEELIELVVAAFPGREVAVLVNWPVKVRAAYNRGEVTAGDKPVFRSFRYVREGGRTWRTTARGRKLAEFPPSEETCQEERVW